METIDAIRIVIDQAQWTQSKGYDRPTDGAHVAPHQYIVRQRQPDAFMAIKTMIERSPDSYRASYGGYRYTYWPFDGYRYWVMGVILNRVPLPEAEADPLAGDDPTAVDYRGQRDA